MLEEHQGLPTSLPEPEWLPSLGLWLGLFALGHLIVLQQITILYSFFSLSSFFSFHAPWNDSWSLHNMRSSSPSCIHDQWFLSAFSFIHSWIFDNIWAPLQHVWDQNWSFYGRMDVVASQWCAHRLEEIAGLPWIQSAVYWASKKPIKNYIHFISVQCRHSSKAAEPLKIINYQIW